MKKRFVSALLALFLLMTALPVSGQAEQERFRTMEDLASWIFYDCAYMLADEIEFGYTQALDYVFDDDFPWKMLFSSGMVNMNVSIDRTHRRVTISDIEYYPGFKAAQAWTLDITHILDADERTMLAHAQSMVEEACLYAQSPYQVLVNLHDALIKRVVYTRSNSEGDEWNYRDTAIGALVYGQSECDGYADSFYLLATLCGFQARMISGYADGGNGSYESHMWNLIWWEDGWYHVDVTLDDIDWDQNPAMAAYQFLLMGSSTITTHQWDASHLVSQPQTYTNWDYYYYTCDNSGITYGAYYKTLTDAANYAAYMQRNYDQHMIHIMIDGDYDEKYDPINDALIQSGLQGHWMTWAKKRGEYSYISICIF